MNRALVWMPAALLAVGAVFTTGVDLQRALPLRQPLSAAVPVALAGHRGHDVALSDAEVRVAGVSSYLLREYAPSPSAPMAFSIYVGYYEAQLDGRTIHSPKNCLPGTGWEALAATTTQVQGPQGPVTVNHYMLQRGDSRALVLYWYQGRGRVAANEYLVKWHLLRDAAVRRRSDEALVRIVVPLQGGEAAAGGLAHEVAAALVPAVQRALPH